MTPKRSSIAGHKKRISYVELARHLDEDVVQRKQLYLPDFKSPKLSPKNQKNAQFNLNQSELIQQSPVTRNGALLATKSPKNTLALLSLIVHNKITLSTRRKNRESLICTPKSKRNIIPGPPKRREGQERYCIYEPTKVKEFKFED